LKDKNSDEERFFRRKYLFMRSWEEKTITVKTYNKSQTSQSHMLHLKNLSLNMSKQYNDGREK